MAATTDPRGGAVAALLLLGACGGGGGGTTTPAVPPPPPPEPIVLFDSIPAPAATVDPSTADISLTHRSPAGLRFAYAGPCRGNAVALRRSLVDLSAGNDDRLVEHLLPCTLADAAFYTVAVNATDTANQRHRGELRFSTGTGASDTLAVLAQSTTTRHAVDRLFDTYVDEALIDEIDSRILRALARVTVGKIADASWRELTARVAEHDVVAQRVGYASRDPDGGPARLTGLVAFPDIADDPAFRPKDRLVVLSHATGSTPSALRVEDGWYVLANIIAGRGYLVVAPDNFGRGGSATDPVDGTEQPETYLMANRVAMNTLDLVSAVLADDDYAAFRPEDASTDVVTIGYSQGGQSAVAFWLAAQVGQPGFKVRELYSGGAPHGLYESFRGILQRLHGTCDGNPWCKRVDLRAVVPYATDRILPALAAYEDIGLELDDLVEGDRLADDFVAGMLNNDPRYDSVKILLQRSSFTNLVEPARAMTVPDTRIRLYHSRYDRLVPAENTKRLLELLTPEFDARYLAEECDSALYKVLAETIKITGLVHSICGLEALDEALQDMVTRQRSLDAHLAYRDDAPGRWLHRAEVLAREALADPGALAEFAADTSTEDIDVLAGLLRDADSADLDALADELAGH